MYNRKMYTYPVERKDSEGVADLHLHTVFSDGTYDTEGLLRTAHSLKINIISITDHDSVSGVEESIAQSGKYGIEVIPGLELTCSEGKNEIHILGYMIDHTNPLFLAELKSIQKIRKERMGMIVDILRKKGLPIDRDSFFREVEAESISRLHLAMYLIRHKIAGSLQEVFQKYLGDGLEAHLNVNAMTPEKGIGLIRRFGGIPVFAHPGLTRRDDLIPEMIKWGLKGLEVFNTTHSGGAVSRYLELAEKYNLFVTGGSDCHGLNKKNRLIGKVRLPVGRVEAMKTFWKDSEVSAEFSRAQFLDKSIQVSP